MRLFLFGDQIGYVIEPLALSGRGYNQDKGSKMLLQIGECCFEGKSFFKDHRPKANERAVDERADDRADANTVQLGKTEEKEGEADRNEAAYAIVAGFEFIESNMEARGDLSYEEIVRLGGKIRMEEEGETEGGNDQAEHVTEDFKCERIGHGNQSKEGDGRIQDETVKDGGDE